MRLKLLHSADWHLDSPFASLPAAQRDQLRKSQLRIPGLIAELCIREGCDAVLLAGDLFDGAASPDSITIVKQALKRCCVPVLIAPGNHDYCSPDSIWLNEVWPENVTIFTGGLEYRDFPELNLRVYGAGYQSMDCPPLLSGFHADRELRYSVGLLHADPLQLNSPCCPITAAQVRESMLDYLALGHIHKSGSFRSGHTLCGWPGCPMGRGWDETGEKSVYLVTMDETAEIQTLPLNLPRFHDLMVDIQNNPRSALERILPAGAGADLFRVTLQGTGDADLPQLKSDFSHVGFVELRDETRAPVDLWADTDTDSLKGLYFRMLKDQLAASDAETAEMIQKAAEISRLLLDGREVPLP